MNQGLVRLLAATILCQSASASFAADWPRFRGPGGRGVSADSKIPLEWSDSKNLKWNTTLPGAGSSSPIASGDRIFVTCYSGTDASMQRFLVCVNRGDGKIVWSKAIDAEQPEDRYSGYIQEHGYASNTPVTDGETVFAHFGKTGVVAYDFDGKQLWQAGVGKESSNRRWGSAASLVLHGDTVIVNAAEESQSIQALDKQTGREIWKTEAGTLELAYGTPNLVSSGDRTELVISVPGEVWGLNPDNGKLRWYAETNLTGNVTPSIIAGDGVVYTFGGFRSSGSHAIRLGGRSDVTDSHMDWTSRNTSYVATPLLYDGRLYWVDDRGQAHCSDAKTGESIYRERLQGLRGGGRPVYASPVMADGRIYVVSRYSGTYVFTAGPEFEQIGLNTIASDESDFSGTPAISGNEMFLRSNEALYCVAEPAE